MRLPVFLFMLMLLPAAVFAEPVVSSRATSSLGMLSPANTGTSLIEPGDVLTIDRCVEIALRKNPGIVAAANTLNASRSRVGGARATYYPQITASAGYNRMAPAAGTSSTSTQFGPRYDQYAGSVTVNQNIIDFGKTSSAVNMAKYNFQSSQADLVTTENATVLNVKQAYYGVLQANRNLEVASDVIRQFQHHLDQAQGFYEVGTRARIDVIKAEVDLSNAQLSLINAENALKISWLNLNTVMGVPDAPEYSIEDNLSFQEFSVTLEEATAKALENRPELRSIVSRRQAAESGVTFARSGYFPVLSGSAGYTKSGADINSDDLNDGWQAGVLLTVPLFSGFLTRHQVAEAKANVYVLKANEEAVRQQILLDVRQAFLNLQAAQAGISTSELAAQQAKENLDLANGRYAAGVGSPVEVSDAFATYVSAQANYTGTLSNYKIAQANIIRAMGSR